MDGVCVNIDRKEQGGSHLKATGSRGMLRARGMHKEMHGVVEQRRGEEEDW